MTNAKQFNCWCKAIRKTLTFRKLKLGQKELLEINKFDNLVNSENCLNNSLQSD